MQIQYYLLTIEQTIAETRAPSLKFHTLPDAQSYTQVRLYFPQFEKLSPAPQC